MQRLSDEAANIRFTEELNFETEVAEAAALSGILLSKKPRQGRGRDEFRNNNWWTQGYRNWDDAAFKKRLRVSCETFEFILAEIENDIVKTTFSNEAQSHATCHPVGNMPVSTCSWVYILDSR